jgi:hypothetical protein
MKVVEQQVKEWKAKYGEGNVLRYAVPVGKDDIAEGFFVRPSAQTSTKLLALYSRAMTAYHEKKTLICGQIILNECFLGGDERFKDTGSMVHISTAEALVHELDFLVVQVSVA